MSTTQSPRLSMCRKNARSRTFGRSTNSLMTKASKAARPIAPILCAAQSSKTGSWRSTRRIAASSSARPIETGSMADDSRVAFLKWCLPRLGLRWSGYRKVRGLVGKRLNRRLAELGLADLSAYRTFLIGEPAEWARLEAMCRVPISRFYRDRAVFDAIGGQLLPEAAAAAAARGDNAVKCWQAFTRCGPLFCLERGIREGVQFELQDIRRLMPDGPFDLILCRNLAFTYFDDALQCRISDQLRESLRRGGFLVLGTHEALPGEVGGFTH